MVQTRMCETAGPDSDSSLSLAPVSQTAAAIIDGKMFPSAQLSIRQAVLGVQKLLSGLE